MPNPYEEKLAELADRGLDPEDVEELRNLLSASPVRKERDEWKSKAENYRNAALRSTFRDVGIKFSPDVLRIPDDLDPDADKVREWAIKGGLIDPPQPSAEELAAQQELADDLAADGRVAAAHSGSTPHHSGVITPDDAAGWSQEKWARFEKQYGPQAEALAEGKEVTGIVF